MPGSRARSILAVAVAGATLAFAAAWAQKGDLNPAGAITLPIDDREARSFIQRGAPDCRVGAPRNDWERGRELAFWAWSANPSDRASALGFARCCRLLAESRSDKLEIIAITLAGMRAVEKAVSKPDPESAYWRGAHLGLYLRTRGLQSADEFEELVSTLNVAAEEPQQEEGGPLRELGYAFLSLRESPLVKDGSKQALVFLRRSVTEYPGHPLNHLLMAKALKVSGDRKGAAAEARSAISKCDKAKWGEYAARWLEEAKSLLP